MGGRCPLRTDGQTNKMNTSWWTDTCAEERDAPGEDKESWKVQCLDRVCFTSTIQNWNTAESVSARTALFRLELDTRCRQYPSNKECENLIRFLSRLTLGKEQHQKRDKFWLRGLSTSGEQKFPSVSDHQCGCAVCHTGRSGAEHRQVPSSQEETLWVVILVCACHALQNAPSCKGLPCCGRPRVPAKCSHS